MKDKLKSMIKQKMDHQQKNTITDSRSGDDPFQEPRHSIIQPNVGLRQDETDSENDLQEISHSEQKLESEWVGVVRRKGERKKPESRGMGANRSRKLEAAKQMAWLYVGILQGG